MKYSNKVALKGEVMVFAEGEYSDFEYGPLVRVLRDFEPAAKIVEYRVKVKKTMRALSPFIVWLQSEGYISEEIDYCELWFLQSNSLGGLSSFGYNRKAK